MYAYLPLTVNERMYVCRASIHICCAFVRSCVWECMSMCIRVYVYVVRLWAYVCMSCVRAYACVSCVRAWCMYAVCSYMYMYVVRLCVCVCVCAFLCMYVRAYVSMSHIRAYVVRSWVCRVLMCIFTPKKYTKQVIVNNMQTDDDLV